MTTLEKQFSLARRASGSNCGSVGGGLLRSLLLGAVALLFYSLPAQALLLLGGNIDTTAPGTSFNGSTFSTALPWDFVGRVNGASGIYLGDVGNNGNFWVLTADHVAGSLPASATFGGLTYNTVAGSWSRLSNSDNTPTDLAMFRLDIASNPSGLGTVSLRTTTPFTTQDLYYVGYGGGTKRWGYNNVEGLALVAYGYGNVTGIVTDYDTGSSNPNEAQAIGGDSGGAAFTYNSSSNSWQLAAVMLAVGTSELPWITFSADIATYRSEILATAPEPATWAWGIGTAAIAASALYHRKRARAPHAP